MIVRLLWGVIGFGCYDALRLYRYEAERFLRGEGGWRIPRLAEHLATVLIAAVFVGGVAAMLSQTNPQATWYAFSAPTAALAFRRPDSTSTEDDAVPYAERSHSAVVDFLRRNFGV